MQKRFLNSLGFSLVELMLAVGIVGVVSVVGYGQWQHYRLRAIQGAAKVDMSRLWSSAQTFRARYYQYFGDWRNLGFMVQGEIPYRVGFWTSAGTVSPVAPANYRGPGVAAGGQGSQVNSGNACGASCMETQDACFLDNSCVWGVDTLVVCSGFLNEQFIKGESTSARRVLRMDESKNFIADIFVTTCL